MLAPARWTGAAMLGLGVLVSDPADSATLREGLDGTWTGQGAIAAGYETTARTARCRVEDGAYYQSRLRIDLLDDTRFRILHWLQPESADSARQTLAIEFHRIAEAP